MVFSSETGMKELLGPRWVEIDTDALRHNVAQVLSLLRPPCRLLAVVKADAYGFGAVEAARVALEGGAAMLGVTLVEEGLELRAAGIGAPVLVFAPPLPEEAGALVGAGLTATVTDGETARCLARAAREVGRRAKVHVKVDTGLGRLGVAPAGVVALLGELASLPELELEGLYSHLAATGPALQEQAEVFAAVCRTVAEAGWHVPLRHLCSSAGLLRFPACHWEMVRVGTLLYGQWPEGCPRSLALRDPWQVKARLLQIRELPPGSRVGYGGGFRLRRRRTLGVIAVGYSDGLTMAPVRPPENWRELVHHVGKSLLGFGRWYRGTVAAEVNGRTVPLVGRLSMQLAVLDLSAAGPVVVGQEVVLRGMRRTAASARLPRLYLAGGRPYRLRWRQEWLDLAAARDAAGAGCAPRTCPGEAEEAMGLPEDAGRQ